MDAAAFSQLADQYPEEFQALKARLIPAVSFSNIYGEEIHPNFYERILAAGYSPEENLLAAVISIRRCIGYNGLEHVRFFVDWKGNGAVAEMTQATAEITFRISDRVSLEPMPFCYGLAAHGLAPLTQILPRTICHLRVILSWQETIPDAGFHPTWGDRHECRICLCP